MAAPRHDRLSARSSLEPAGDPRKPYPAAPIGIIPVSTLPPAPTYAEARQKLRQARGDCDAGLAAKAERDARISGARQTVSKCKTALRKLQNPDPYAPAPAVSTPTKVLRASIGEAERALQDATDDLSDLERGVPPYSTMVIEGHWVSAAARDVLRCSPEAAVIKQRYEALAAEMSRLLPVVGYLFGSPLVNCFWDDTMLREWKNAAAALERDADAKLPVLP